VDASELRARARQEADELGPEPPGTEADLWREERWGAVVLLAGLDAVMTRQRYVAPYPTGTQWIGDSEFTNMWAGTVGDHLDPAIVQADLDGLRSGATRLVRHYVNKEVAHHDEKGAVTIPTFADLDEAIDNLGTLLTRYGTLLTGSNLAVPEPVVQYDWEAPFRQPWIEE
jgi:hypothetical protein